MFQIFIQSATTSLDSLWANKIRSLITMLGIIIGVSSVVLIMSIGSGAQSLILSQIESLGSGLINVNPGSSGDSPIDAIYSSFGSNSLDYDDVLYLKNHRGAPYVIEVAGYVRGFAAVEWRSEVYDTALTGVTASFINVEDSQVEAGRFFTEEEEASFTRVVVLGSTVKDALFGDSDALGKRVSVGNTNYEVIGIMEERGTVGLDDYDDQIFLPIKTAQRVMGVTSIGFIRAKVDSDKNLERSIRDIEVLLREAHDIRDATGKEDDFSVAASGETIELIVAITDGLRFFLAAMAALSLLVGGIGIMNIMFISVTERTREIGLRKAIGANNKHILGQFLLEAVFVTGIGGLIGMMIGILLSFLISLSVRFAGFDWVFVISPLSIILALTVSVGVGLFFGFYPAQKASKLEPIAALHYE